MLPFLSPRGRRAAAMRMAQQAQLEGIMEERALEGAIQRRAVNRGRIQGYATAIRDVKGADRLERFAKDHNPSVRPRGAVVETSGGTPITEDARQKYLHYKAKHNEYGRLLEEGPRRENVQGWVRKRHDGHGKHPRLETLPDTIGSFRSYAHNQRRYEGDFRGQAPANGILLPQQLAPQPPMQGAWPPQNQPYDSRYDREQRQAAYNQQMADQAMYNQQMAASANRMQAAHDDRRRGQMGGMQGSRRFDSRGREYHVQERRPTGGFDRATAMQQFRYLR